MRIASWIIVEKGGVVPVLETYKESIAAKVNRDRFEVYSAEEWLITLNRMIKEGKAG